MVNYSIWMLEYSHCPTQTISSLIYSQHNQGVQLAAYSYLVLQSEEHIVMVDVGYDYRTPSGKTFADKFDVTDWQSPEKVLAKIGLHPKEVDTVLLTHAHYDHMGAISSFPNAHFYIQKKEMEDWWKMLAMPKAFSFLTAALNPEDMKNADNLIKSGRMTLVEGTIENVLPGINLIPVFDSHTYGSQLITIENNLDNTHKERWVVAGDNCFSYKSLLGINNDGVYLPVGFAVGSQTIMIQALDMMMNLAHGDVEHIILGHETASWQHFPSWKSDDGLYAAEITLAPSQKSYLPK